MSYVSDRAARLYYDDGCGPCGLLARAAEEMSGHHVLATPLTAPLAERDLGELEVEGRLGYAHLLAGDRRWTGADLTTPLIGYLFGPRAEATVRRIRPLDRALAWAYGRLWQYRRLHGCGASSRSS